MLQELMSFAIVLVVAVCVAGAVSVLYACGLQLLQPQAPDGARGADTAGTANAHSHSALRRAGAVACFAACVAIVLVALYLIVGA